MHFTCPYCQTAQVVQGAQKHSSLTHLDVQANAEGPIGVRLIAITCANPRCAQTSIEASLNRLERPKGVGIWVTRHDGKIQSWKLRPASRAKPLPDYIPQAIIEDYAEACLIRDLSPKASATLIRRCLQGMIRDFCGIKEATLAKELGELRKRVDAGAAPQGVSSESVDAIDQIRGVGNIGAHMEKDVTHIIPVDPDEAQVLIELTEMLIEEWYVARKKRQDRLAALQALAADKDELRKGSPALIPPPQAE